MIPTDQNIQASTKEQLPGWFKQELPDMNKIREMKQRFRYSDLHTVCESALCPNMGRCWREGVATFMILGGSCTRSCRFCAVKTGRPVAVDPNEPRKVARSVGELSLRYVVVTSVTRDDLEDGGARHFAATIRAIRAINPKTKVEVLVPDFLNRLESLQRIVDAHPEVIGHNIETVRRLSPIVRPQANYDRSLNVLRNYRKLNPSIFLKSSLMVGLGEEKEEIIEAMQDLIRSGCDILAIGQYLAPTQQQRHIKVQRFVTPEEFEFYRKKGLEIGFKHVISGPLVRSSFIADRGYQECFDQIHGLQIG